MTQTTITPLSERWVVTPERRFVVFFVGGATAVSSLDARIQLTYSSPLSVISNRRPLIKSCTTGHHSSAT